MHRTGHRGLKRPSREALWQARARVGTRPLRWLFELLTGPIPDTAGWRGLLVCAIDDHDGRARQPGEHGSLAQADR